MSQTLPYVTNCVGAEGARNMPSNYLKHASIDMPCKADSIGQSITFLIPTFSQKAIAGQPLHEGHKESKRTELKASESKHLK